MSEKPAVFEPVAEQIDEEDKFSTEEKERFKDFFLEYYEEMSYESEDIRLDRFSAENFRTISESDVDFDRSDTVLFGENSKGKTSLIKGILYNIAGLPENPSEYEMTRLVRSGTDILNTVGYWTIDDSPYTLERSLRQKGQGSSLSGHQEPYLSEGHTTEASISGKFTDPSDTLEMFGLQELKQRGHDPYEVLSLYFLMSEDFTRFLGETHSELMDLLFGINITTVVSAVENKIEDLELSESEVKSTQRLRQYQNERDSLREELADVKDRYDAVMDDLQESEDELQYIQDSLEGQNKLDRLRNRKSELQSRRADYKVEKSEVVENLASIRRRIERYEDTELVDDMKDVEEELNNFMTVPNRCPICTNPVNTEQREDLLNEANCPLCRKDMPEDRYHNEVEYEEPESEPGSRNDEQERSLESLREEKSELESKKERLKSKIERTDSEIEKVSNKISNSDLSDLAEEQEALQKEVRTLRNKAVELDVKRSSLSEKLESVQYEVLANEHLRDQAKEKKSRRDSFKRFKSIIEQSRIKRRRNVKDKLAKEIRKLFQYFNHGTLEEAHDVTFKSGGSYHFTIKTPGRDLDSAVTDESTAEINLHAILFHTAVLKELSKSINNPPLRIFTIDSPFSNEVDENNTKDIENFLVSLPEILPEYQILLASAETGSFDPQDYTDNYQLERFN